MVDLMNPAHAWTAVAAAWDAHVDAIDDHSAPATDQLVTRLAVRPGDTVLELAAGPGSLGATWASLVAPDGNVVLSDIAPGMVAVARRRNAALGNVRAEVIDATEIARPDASFDVVACRMGLMFTPDPSIALAEMHRVLRPGGRLGVLTWGAMERNPWMTCVGMAAMMNGLVAGGPPTAPGGIFSLADTAVLAQMARAAGFVDVGVDAIPVTFRSRTVDEHVARVASLAGPLAAVLEQAPQDQQEAFRRTAHDLAAAHLTPDGLEIGGEVLILTAQR